MASPAGNRHPFTRRAVLGGAAAAAVTVAAQTPAHAEEPCAGGRLDQDLIDQTAAPLEADLIALRRDIHAHPEGPGQESRTAAAVAERLTAAGLSVTTGVGGHGVVGVLEGRRRGRTVAYRADMDAVPPGDQVGGGEAVAHLCGHDLHTAIGVGVAQTLARLRDRLRGTVVFFFQPAEEALTGAQAMIDDGVLEWTRPDEIHALHCGPFAVGEFVTTPGTGLPGQDIGVLTLTGPDAAERAEHLAADIGTLTTVAPPETPEEVEQLVDDFLTLDSPLSRFVYMGARIGDVEADRAEVELRYRCWPEDRYTEVREEVRRIAASYGDVEVSFLPEPFPAMVCPEREGRALKRHLRHAMETEVSVMQCPVPFSGEDFGLFLDRMPGTFTYLGVRSPGAEVVTSYPHFGTFVPDERAIGHGVRGMAGWLAERARR